MVIIRRSQQEGPFDAAVPMVKTALAHRTPVGSYRKTKATEEIEKSLFRGRIIIHHAERVDPQNLPEGRFRRVIFIH